MVYSCNGRTWEAEAKRLLQMQGQRELHRVQDQPQLHNESVSKKKVKCKII